MKNKQKKKTKDELRKYITHKTVTKSNKLFLFRINFTSKLCIHEHKKKSACINSIFEKMKVERILIKKVISNNSLFKILNL